MSKYKTCLKTKLEAAQKNADFCTCGTPCLEALFVSSLSFASIATTEDSIKARQDTETYMMQRNLSNAREVAFRVQEDKYNETMRVFHITESQVRNTGLGGSVFTRHQVAPKQRRTQKKPCVSCPRIRT